LNEETGQFISDRSLIALKYLQFWFWIDTVATIQFDSLIPLFINSAHNLSAIRMIRFLRILRLGKVYKVLSKDGFISRLKINPQLIQLLVLIGELFFVAHIFACFWHFIALPQNSSQYFQTWLKKFGYENAIESDRYVTSLYYIIVTMLTIGYGDIYPTNQLERIFAIFTMVVGVIVFSTLMSKVANLFNKMNPQAQIVSEKMEEIKCFLVEIELPRHLRDKVKQEYAYYYEKKALLGEVGISNLAKPMLMSLLFDLYNADIQEIHLFSDESLKSKNLIYSIIHDWKPFFGVAGDVLYRQGDIFRKIVFLKEGLVRISNTARLMNTSAESNMGSTTVGTSLLLGGVYAGEFFGEVEYVKSTPSMAHYSVVKQSTFFAVDHGVINQFISENQFGGDQLSNLFNRRRDDFMELIRDPKVVGLRSAVVRFRNLDTDKLEKFTASSQIELYINGSKCYFEKYFKDFIEISDKDARDAVEAAKLNDSFDPEMSEVSSVDEMEDLPDSQMITCLVQNPLATDKKEMIIEEYPISILRKKFLFTPLGTFKTIWDIVIAFVVVVSVLVIPVQIAFLYDAFPGTDIFNYVIVCFFGVDMIFTFRTVIEAPSNDAWIIDPHEIAMNYLKGWFLIDLISTLPFNVISMFTTVNNSVLILFQLAKFMRLFWLFKMKRLAKAAEKFEDYLGLSPSLVKVVVLFVKVYFIVHWMACIWWGVSRPISPRPWFTDSGPDGMFYGRLENVHVSAQYLMSLYFTFTTMTTVGYGDIHQINPAERVMSIPYLLFSASVFGFMLATISSVVGGLTESDSIITDKISLITEYLQEKKCTKQLKDQIIYYYQRHLKEDTGYDIDDITSKIPDYLSNEILSLFYSSKMNNIVFFRFVEDKSVQLYLFRLLKPVFYEPDSYVQQEHDELNENIYFLTAGTCRVFKDLLPANKRKGNQKTSVLRRGLKRLNESQENIRKLFSGSGSPSQRSIHGELEMTTRNNYKPVRDRRPSDESELASLSHEEQVREATRVLHEDSLHEEINPNISKSVSLDFGTIYGQESTDSPPEPKGKKDYHPLSLEDPQFKSRRSSNRSTSARSTTSQSHHRRRTRSNSFVSKEDALKIVDPFKTYEKKIRKPFCDFQSVDFDKLGYKLLADIVTSDFFGYSHFMDHYDEFQHGPSPTEAQTWAEMKRRFLRHRTNAYSVRTASEVSFMVLEKTDLLSLVRLEPIIAMQLQMALAKSILVQSKAIDKSHSYHTKKHFIHRLKRSYLSAQHQKIISYKKKNGNNKQEVHFEQKDFEDDELPGIQKYLRHPSKIRTYIIRRFFSQEYKKIKKYGRDFVHEDDDLKNPINKKYQEYQEQADNPPAVSRQVSDITTGSGGDDDHDDDDHRPSTMSTGNNSAPSLNSAPSRRGGPSPSTSRGSLSIPDARHIRRTIRRSISFMLHGSRTFNTAGYRFDYEMKTLIRRSYSMSDLDYYKSPTDLMKQSYLLRAPAPAPRLSLVIPDAQSAGGLKSSLKKSKEPTPTPSQRKSVTFVDQQALPHFRSNFPQTFSPANSVDDPQVPDEKPSSITPFSPEKPDNDVVKVEEQEHADRSPPPPPADQSPSESSDGGHGADSGPMLERSNALTALRLHGPAGEKKESEEEHGDGGSDTLSEEALTHLHRIPSELEAKIVTRPRSYSFPFYGYERWKLSQTDEICL
jgi:CRP-like cAMP-binding protein